MIPRLNGQLNKPKAVYFDWDGTLVDSLAFITKAHNHVRRSLGITPELTKEEFHYYLGMPRAVIFSELYKERADEGETAFVQYYNDNHLSDIQLIEGAQNLLETLDAQGITLGVVSNKRGNFLREEINHLGWDKYFGTRVIGSGDTAEDKPSAMPLEHGLSLMSEKLNKNDIWYVGDTDIDLQCANNAEVVGILYNPKEINISAIHGLKIDQNRHFSVKKYEEICGFLLQSL